MLQKRVGAALTGLILAAGMACAVGSPSAHGAGDTTPTASQICNPGQTQPMFRLYNRETGEHLFSADTNERSILESRGWVYEGVSWVAPTQSSTPVHRLYNSASGDHHYTTDSNEITALTDKHGWKDEGIGWYSDDCQTIDVYRQFNPQLRIGSHNYTTDLKEYNTNNSRGWQGEGVAWYAAEPGWAIGAEPTYVTMGVTVSDNDGSDSDTFTIPETDGLQYRLDGEEIEAGTYKIKDYFTYVNHAATVEVTATVVEDGYRITGGAAGSIYTQDVDDLIKATPTPVTFNDNDGSNNDTFTVPSVTGVQYTVNNNNIAAGTYKVKDYFTYDDYWANPQIKAIAKDGYSLAGATSWTQKIDGRSEVAPQNVTFADKDGQASDTFTVPNVTGIQYIAGNKNVAAGTYAVKDYFTYTNYTASAKVTASPKAGYKFPSNATTSWSQTIDGYTYVDTVAPTGNDASGKNSDTFTIPNVPGVQYKVKGVNMEPGNHGIVTRDANGNATVTITAEPKPGFKIKDGNQKSWTFNYTALVRPQEVMFYDPDGSDLDTVTIPEVEGIYYTIDGVRKAPGTYSVVSQIGPYSNHHRQMSVHAYLDGNYVMASDAQIYYFHKFTDGQEATPPRPKRSTSDYGNCTVAQAKAKTEQFYNDLTARINAGSDYASRTSISDLYGVTQNTVNLPSTPTTLDDRTRELNRRYALRYQERMDAFRAQCGLDTIQAANLTPEAEELAYAHVVATWNYKQAGNSGHYMSDPNLLALEARNNNGLGQDFDGTYGVAENLYYQSGTNFDVTPEELADRSFAGYISEYPYLDGTFNGQNGHLVNILTDNYTVHANYMYVAPFQRQVIGYYYTWENGTMVEHEIYGTMLQLMSIQTPGATWYRN